MNWIPILTDVCSGAAAGLLAYLLVRKPRERRMAFVACFVVSLAAFHQLSSWYVTPRLRAWSADRTLEATFSGMPVYQVIAKYEPDVYEEMMTTMRHSLARGEPGAQVTSRGKALISKLVLKHLPSASDRAVVTYMKVIQEMEQLAAADPVACYHFLYPQGGVSIELSKHVDKQTLDADLAALAEVIRSSSESPQPPSAPDRVQELLEPVYEHLGRVHGADLLVLQSPQEPGVDKKKVCEMVLMLYSKVIDLPEKDSSEVLRYLLSGQQPQTPRGRLATILNR